MYAFSFVTPANAKEAAESSSQPERSVSRKRWNARMVPRVNTSEYRSSRMKREKYMKCPDVSTKTAYAAAAALPIHRRKGHANAMRMRPKIAGRIRAVVLVAPKSL
jgi:hypothetical protein